MTAKNELAVCELFSGVGGMTLGASRGGFTLRGAVELADHACRSHSINFPGIPCWKFDVAKLTGKALLGHFGLRSSHLTGIVGGPPCQGFSVMGHMNVSDERNNLFGHFFRVVSEANPLFFLAENVPGILSKEYDGIRQRAFDMLSAQYDILTPVALCASDFGAPTLRKRVFFVGIRKSAGVVFSADDFLPPKSVVCVPVKDALRGLPSQIVPDWQKEEDGWRRIRRFKGSFANRLFGRVPAGVGDSHSLRQLKENNLVSGCLGTRHSIPVLSRYKKLKQGETDKVSKSMRLSMTGFCPTLRAGTGKERGSYQAIRPIHPIQDRVITPREAARLQGFPDWFRFAPDKWHSFMQIGNSVSPILAEYVFRAIRKRLE